MRASTSETQLTCEKQQQAVESLPLTRRICYLIPVTYVTGLRAVNSVSGRRDIQLPH
jgi:hypothetical protein